MKTNTNNYGVVGVELISNQEVYASELLSITSLILALALIANIFYLLPNQLVVLSVTMDDSDLFLVAVHECTYP